MAFPGAYFRSAVLLRRIRHRAAWRVAGLAQLKTGQETGRADVQKCAGLGVLQAFAGALRRRRYQARFLASHAERIDELCPRRNGRAAVIISSPETFARSEPCSAPNLCASYRRS